MTSSRLFAVALVALAVAFPAAAQDALEPEMREGATYHVITYFDFLPGKGSDATELAYEHLIPATRAAGTNLTVYEPMSGEWDMIAIFEMQDGMQQFAWTRSPATVRQMEAMVERTGSLEEARETYDRFSSMIADSRREIVFKTDAR